MLKLNFIRVAVLVVCLIGISEQKSVAQKIAHVNSEEIIAKLPVYLQAQSNLEAYSVQLQKQLAQKEQAVQAYYQGVVSKIEQGMLAPSAQQAEEQKLNQMQSELQKDLADADQQLKTKEGELLQPIYDKFNEAIKKVALAKGYTYIIDEKTALFAGGEDVTELVKLELAK